MDKLSNTSSTFEYAACGLVTTEVDGTFRTANTTFCNWLSIAAEELIGKKKIQEFFTIGGRFFHHTHWAPLLQMQGSVAEVQMDLVTREGNTLPMLINAIRHVRGENQFDELAFFLATDRKIYEREMISARKAAEDSLISLKDTQKKLKESRDFLSIAIQSARMGVWSSDLITDHMSWNKELEQLTGLAEKQFGGTREAFYSLIHTDDRNSFVAALEDAIQTKSNYNLQFRLHHTSGHWLTMEGRGHAVYSPKGEAQSIFGVVIDITEREAAEEKLRELNQELSIADRRKDEFLATLAHELRNPLAPMRNVLEIMRFKKINDSFFTWARDVIDRHVSQMQHLVDDLMEATRISQGRLELRWQQLDIAETIKHAIEISQALMEESKHKFIVKMPDNPIVINADSTRIVQIISNLLTNAAKYTHEGGKIFLTVYQDVDGVVISVRDTGIGIPSEQLSNIFKMFSQLTPALERSQGGLGIGLSLVRGLVELHGGSISARSEGEGKGSEFIVRLPISISPLEKIEPAKASAQTPRTGKRILVVDDNIDAADSLAMLLRMTGHMTCTAHDGTTGLALAEKFNADVVLLDIGLPDINGYEVARRIREQAWGKNILLIAATGWGQDKDKELAKDAGFDNHLTKPINFQDLNFALQRSETG